MITHVHGIPVADNKLALDGLDVSTFEADVALLVPSDGV